ncbi:MAG: RNA methyltransferase [Bacteroidetes bacterium]|nr:RNA methyltransferase [Bacteroidota bacterium]
MPEKLSMDELGRMDADAFKASAKNRVVLVLDNIRSLNNVGSAFRTADAFLIESIYLCGVTGTPPNKEIEKTALGATSTVSWKHVASTQEAVQELKQKGYYLAAVEQAKGSTMLHEFKKPDQPIALVFGNEVYGVEQAVIDQCDACLEIPQYGTKHSLNVSVSMGIVLWELLRS